MPLTEEHAEANRDQKALRRPRSFRRKCAHLALVGGLMAAALTPIDIASWAGDTDLHLHPQTHLVILVVIVLLITPWMGQWIVAGVLGDRIDMWVAAQGELVDRIVDERLTARRDELVTVFTDLVHEIIHHIEPRQQHLINEAVRSAVKPQIAEIKKGVASGLNAATRAGLIAGAQQNAQPRPSRRRGPFRDTTVPTLGTVRQFREVSNDK